MKILKERTRLIFSDYTDLEHKRLEDKVASMDNIYMYVDEDKHILALPTGMEATVKKMFPDATFEDKSDEYWPYDKIQPVQHEAKPRNQLQIDFINFVLKCAKEKKKLAGILSPGSGKLHPNYTKLPAPNEQGYIKLGDLNVGDKIFGSDGSQITVTNIFEHPNEDIYKITFSDGRYSLCGADHLWPVMKTWTSKITVMTTKEMIESGLFHYSRTTDGSNRSPFRPKYRIPLLASPVEYDFREVPIHPYIIGAFIGNGCCTQPFLSLSSGDDFVPKKIAYILGATTKKEKGSYTYIFHKNGHLLKTVDVFKDILEICGKYSHEKCIPDLYMYNSLEVRIELLRGLMDTDGSISYNEGRYNVSYSSCSRKLLEQIRELILGLGFICNIGSPDKREEKYRYGYHASVSIRVPNKFKQELFTHPRKHKIAYEASFRGDFQQSFTHLIIKDIQKVSKADSRCITVDADDHLYLTEDFIVTHNTFMACYSAISVGDKTLIIVPTSAIKDQWVDTLVKMFNVPAERVKGVSGPKDFINCKADFVVVSHATLASINKTYDLEKIMYHNRFGIKVIDEVQMWFKNIIQVDANSNIANNWYITGTFGRSGNKENELYQEMFGDLEIFREEEKKPTLFNRKPGNIYGMKPYINIKMLWMNGGLTEKQRKKVTASMRYSEREGKWIRFGLSVPIYTEMTIPSDGTKTKYLSAILKTVQIAEKEVKYGSTLVLVGTIAATEVVASYLRELFPNKSIATYSSNNSKEDNAKNKMADIVVSTVQSAGTGFDKKGLGKLIVTVPFKSWILADQISGRCRRRDDGKDCYMWELVDKSIPQLRAWANVRADVYRRKSKKFTVVDFDV